MRDLMNSGKSGGSDDYDVLDEPSNDRKLLFLALGVVILLAFGFIFYSFVLRGGDKGSDKSVIQQESSVPILLADGILKAVPKDVGGLEIRNQDSQVFEVIENPTQAAVVDAREAEKERETNLLPPQEEPQISLQDTSVSDEEVIVQKEEPQISLQDKSVSDEEVIVQKPHKKLRIEILESLPDEEPVEPAVEEAAAVVEEPVESVVEESAAVVEEPVEPVIEETAAVVEEPVESVVEEPVAVVEESVESVVEEPVAVIEEPVEPVVEESVAVIEEPVEPVVEESVAVVEEPVESAVEESVAVVEEPVESVVEEPVAVVEEPVSVVEEPVESAVEEPVAVVEEPVESVVEEPVAVVQEPVESVVESDVEEPQDPFKLTVEADIEESVSVIQEPVGSIVESETEQESNDDETYIIQLGALNSRSSAEILLSSLISRLPNIDFGDKLFVQESTLSDGGIIFRVQSRGLTQGDARRYCAEIKSVGRDCFIRDGS